MQCMCNPKHVYKTDKSFQSHLLTKRHKNWIEVPHEVIAQQSRRKVSEYTKKLVAATANWKCELCYAVLNVNYEIDHKLALYLGGTNEKENLQSLCPDCHRTKTKHEYEDYQFAKQAYDAYMK